MIIADANLLFYALHADTPQHAAAKAWLEDCINGEETLALSWVVVLAVLRLSTNSRLFPAALSVDDALAVVQTWLDHPRVQLIEPGPEHWSILSNLLKQVGRAGNLTPDAHLAALAIEHKGEVHSSDRDFNLFRGLRFRNPLG